MRDYKRVYDEKWNFKEHSMKEYVHGLHPYPAMMMPLIAREMLSKYGKGKDTAFFDPYVGSGTTIAEAQLYGAKEAFGFDLNPLAILISKVKTSPLNIEDVKKRFEFFENYKNIDESSYKIPNFFILKSWFRQENIVQLAKIKKFVLDCDNQDTLDFYKMCFSEVVRSVSETRNGEFKLYRMPKKSLDNFRPNAFEMFEQVVERNIKIFEQAKPVQNTDVHLIYDNSANCVKKYNLKDRFDLIVTSPPYGDSHTTVAYGQFSRLSNEWLDFSDAGHVDSKLMGGKKSDDYKFDIEELDDAILKIKDYDLNNNGDRYKSVISFYKDYFETIEAISQTLKIGGYAIYVVGNRRVRNIELPLDVITYKMFEKFGYSHEITFVRDILNKRMPSKASPSNRKGGQISTMTKEYIVVMKRIK